MDKLRIPGLVLAIGLACLQANADDVADKYFGQGVHAYFNGDAEQALKLFTQAVDHGTNDPRIFYFRGLAMHGVGDTTAGNADFDKAAMLEAQGNGGGFDSISRSLERVQGVLRLTLEERRREGYVAFASKKKNVVGRPTYIDSKKMKLKDPPNTTAKENQPEKIQDVTGSVDKTVPFIEIDKKSDQAVGEKSEKSDDAVKAPNSILKSGKSDAAEEPQPEIKNKDGEVPAEKQNDAKFDDPFAEKSEKGEADDSGKAEGEPVEKETESGSKDADEKDAENKDAENKDSDNKDSEKKEATDDPFNDG